MNISGGWGQYRGVYPNNYGGKTGKAGSDKASEAENDPGVKATTAAQGTVLDEELVKLVESFKNLTPEEKLAKAKEFLQSKNITTMSPQSLVDQIEEVIDLEKDENSTRGAMAASQARLLELQARINDLEAASEKISNMKEKIENSSKEIYNKYMDLIYQKEIEFKKDDITQEEIDELMKQLDELQKQLDDAIENSYHIFADRYNDFDHRMLLKGVSFNKSSDFNISLSGDYVASRYFTKK